MAKKPTPPAARPAQSNHVSVTTQQWQGPLPPPAALAQFDQIVPGGAERIFKMVEQEQAHRIDHEKTELVASIRDFRAGQIMGFVLGMACLAGAVYTAVIGAHPTVSVALVSLPIMAAIKTFLKR